MGVWAEGVRCSKMKQQHLFIFGLFQPTFSNWARDEPNNWGGNGGEDCVETSRWKWNDIGIGIYWNLRRVLRVS